MARTRVLAGDAPVTLIVDGTAHELRPGDPIPVDDTIPVGCVTEAPATAAAVVDDKPAKPGKEA